MVNKKNLLASLGLLLSLFAVLFGAYYASSLKEQARKSGASGTVELNFSPTELTSDINTVLTPKIVVNPVTYTVSAVELYLSYDKSLISIEEITPSVAFPTVLKSSLIDNDLGAASITLGVSAVSPITELSDLINLKVKTKTTYGDTTIDVSENSKVAALENDTTVLGTLGKIQIHIVDPNAVVSTPTSTATATAIATAAPTDAPIGGYIEGEPNSCGGTCGSNNNCKINLYCYKGFCRNPICSESSDCLCTTSTATVVATATTSTIVLKTTAKSTTSAVSAFKSTAISTSKPVLKATNKPEVSVTTDELKNESLISIYKYFVLAVVFILLTLVVRYFVIKNKDSKSNILPPVNI